MSTPSQQLLDAVHDLLNEINESDYVDMVGSEAKLQRVKDLSGWPAKVLDQDPFAPVLYTGQPLPEIEQRNKETMTALQPVGYLTDEQIRRVMDKAMHEITGGSNTFSLTADKVWASLIRATGDELSGQRKADEALLRTDLRAAAQQALEAMQSFESGTGGIYAGEFANEIDALRAALAEPDLHHCPQCGGPRHRAGA